MKLQIIESISKHAVTLVLVIGILMLTEKVSRLQVLLQCSCSPEES